MAVWGCQFDIFLGGGGGGRGVRIFQIWGGLSFLGLSFPDLLGGGEFLGLSFPDLGVLRSEFLKNPCKAETQVNIGRYLQWHHWLWCRVALSFPGNINFLSVQWKAGMFTSSVKKMFLKITLLLLVNHDQFSSCKCRELQLYKADNKKLCGRLRETYQGSVCHNIFRFKWDEMSL